MAWHKSPGESGVSPNAIKALKGENVEPIFKNIERWWYKNVHEEEYKEWRSAPLKIPPKQGEVMNPNNWRGIVLMEITSKLLSGMINSRLQIEMA